VAEEINPFQKPRLSLNRIYTRQGDSGQTRLAGGQTVGKDSARVACYGAVDELNALVGQARCTATDAAKREPRLVPLTASLLRVQHELFNLGSILATKPGDEGPRQPRIRAEDVARLESEIDAVNIALEPLDSFLLPGGSRLSADLHLCRTACRHAERSAVGLARTEVVPAEVLQYLNRLGDAFFVWSRQANDVLGAPDVLWNPNQ
jgi:cob(I)alamin adenosyltransferase